ncbi:minor capsid protein [Sporosarcina saromensis]|uniref:Minor capsid protein n=1 Tax=Sporosarcina saromensis TaxID=359365 RepID=A0ABU4G9W6_9BACL|nr:phage minor capsid protein [Sporosarcina saromensis]MDW0113774.1 minor capsid protein [Sporosarcina saromensis]
MSKDVEKFVKLFELSSMNILALIQSSTIDGLTKQRKTELLADIGAIIATVQGDSTDLILSIIEKAYKNGSKEAVDEMRVQGKKDVDATFKSRIHQEAVQRIIDEAFYNVLEATDFMTMDVKQRIESIIQRANQSSLVEGLTRREATKRAVAEVTDKGITGIITKNGANVPVEKYLSGAIHFHQRKAHVDGSINRMIENGQDLLYVNSVGITCSMCAQYQGRVYSISGQDKRFPPLLQRPPYHAHCVHSAYPWNIEYQDEADINKMLIVSNRPFVDNRTDHAIKKYNETQREKSKKNDTRKQWIRYKSRMPDLPDLRTFASHKARNTQTYRDWMEDYRTLGVTFKERDG